MTKQGTNIVTGYEKDTKTTNMSKRIGINIVISTAHVNSGQMISRAQQPAPVSCDTSS